MAKSLCVFNKFTAECVETPVTGGSLPDEKTNSFVQPEFRNRHAISVCYSHHLILKHGKNFTISIYENSYTLISIILFFGDSLDFLFVTVWLECPLLPVSSLPDIFACLGSSLFFFFCPFLRASLKWFRWLLFCLCPTCFTLLADDTVPSGLSIFILSTIKLP